MCEANPTLRVAKPRSALEKPLNADIKALTKALTKTIGHTAIGKWEELGNDAVEALCALGVTTEPGELAFLLIQRSLAKSLFTLVGSYSSDHIADSEDGYEKLLEAIDSTLTSQEFHIDHHFFDRPTELPILKKIGYDLQSWLVDLGVAKGAAKSISDRLPSYFTYELHREWRRNVKSYRPLQEALDSPFLKATDREWAWNQYSAMLQRQIDERVFDEAFGLSQIYIPLNATYVGPPPADKAEKGSRSRVNIVISLERELEQWLNVSSARDPIRVLSGGPGSGKSSFARVFAAKIARSGSYRVLFVPLHLIDPSKDLVDEVGRFLRDEGLLDHNPLDPDLQEHNLLVIFDGLDELVSQGRSAAETGRAFIREVERVVERRSARSLALRVLISGRELIVQQNEAEFRAPRQVLTLMPYFVPKREAGRRSSPISGEYLPDDYWEDRDRVPQLLSQDLRHEWWKKYGKLTGKGFFGLPRQLNISYLDEITAQPLLNYLMALSYARNKIDFGDQININIIYQDLLAAVHERGYEIRRSYGPIRHITLDQFCRVLEEIGLASWHGDGRTATIREIEARCQESGLSVLLSAFEEGAKVGITRLLAAFFFRQYGERDSDPTFVFTHKSFGEYLTARRVIRALEKMHRQLESRLENPDEGWEEREALKHWVQICGPTAISSYLRVFLINEQSLRTLKQVNEWRRSLCKLYNHILRHGMPMEHLHIVPFRRAMAYSRNAEEAILVLLNGCSMITKEFNVLDQPSSTEFSAWFKRIQGQPIARDSVLAASCLSYLDLHESIFEFADMSFANLEASDLSRIKGQRARFTGARLVRATFEAAEVVYADFSQSDLTECNLAMANLSGADLRDANLRCVNAENANLTGANLEQADLGDANFRGANLRNAKLGGANRHGTEFGGAIIEGTILDTAAKKGPWR